MDCRKARHSYGEFTLCVRHHSAAQHVPWFHGFVCHRQDEVEDLRTCDGIFHDGNDDPGTLRIDTSVYEVCQGRTVEQSLGTHTSLSDVFPSDYDLHHDRFLQEPAERAGRVGLHRRMLHISDLRPHMPASVQDGIVCDGSDDLRRQLE